MTHSHFPPCSESLDELVLEPEPDELESSSSESSELELLLALSRDDLGSTLDVGSPLEAAQKGNKHKGKINDTRLYMYSCLYLEVSVNSRNLIKI